MNTKNKKLSWFDFIKRFPDEESCVKFLSDKKWKDGYQCHRCSHQKYCNGNKKYDRRCTSCGYIESPTANTLFHKVKFSLQKALFMVYLESVFKKGISTTQLAELLDLRQGTCWLFKQKITEAMGSTLRYKMKGKVDILICEMGVNQIRKEGKIVEKKKLVALAAERGGDRKTWIYGKTIKNLRAKELIKIFEDHIDKKAQITTSGWNGFGPISLQYVGMKMNLPQKRKSKNARCSRKPYNDALMLIYKQSMGFYNGSVQKSV